MKKLSLCMAAAAAALLLSACGGGDDAPPPVSYTGTVPDSATASVEAYTAYAAALASEGEAANSWTPLMLNATAAPTSETAAPAAVL